MVVFSPCSDPFISLTDGTETLMISTDPHPDQNVRIDPPISESSVLSTESTDAQGISTHSVQPAEIRLFSIKRGFYTSLDPFIDALSCPLIIVATDVSRISALTHITLGHKYA
jgi:hypothetical protein